MSRTRPPDPGPCRACRHYDCIVDRDCGEALPDHVTVYVGGVQYVPRVVPGKSADQLVNPAESSERADEVDLAAGDPDDPGDSEEELLAVVKDHPTTLT